VKVVRGDDPQADTAFFSRMHDLYGTTVDKMWGQRYLSAEFFRVLSVTPSDFRRNLVFVLAYDGDELVAGTINLVKNNRYYGRYWGSFKDYKYLHFEVCYYKAIEWCIENEVDYFEPGAGGGEFKFLRGFDPYLVNSAHYIGDPTLREAIGGFLFQERSNNVELTEYLTENSKLKTK
jgi:predicted N-acyltransferase